MNLVEGEKYLFDTTVFIDKLRQRPIGNALHKQARFKNISVGYSVVTETELWAGIIGMWTEEQHKALLKLYKRYFINVTIARLAGEYYRRCRHELNLKRVPGIGDCYIATTAHFYDLRLVSRNTRDMQHFIQFGVKFDPYQQS